VLEIEDADAEIEKPKKDDHELLSNLLNSYE
jgi:hypothetical protein